MYKIILANNYTEAAGFAREQGFKTGEYRIASKAGSIRGLRVAEVYELPSFSRRRDVHGLRMALKHAKIPAWHLIDDGWEWPLPKWCSCEQRALDAVPGQPCPDCTGRVPEPPQEFPPPTTSTVDLAGMTVSVTHTPVEPVATAGEILPQKPKPAKKAPGRRRPPAKTPAPRYDPASIIDTTGF